MVVVVDSSTYSSFKVESGWSGGGGKSKYIVIVVLIVKDC